MEDMGGAQPNGGQVSCDIMVPDKMVGRIIGRRGETITRLRAESGCNIQLAPDSQGLAERICTLTGSQDAIAEARDAIERIISNEGNGPPRGQFGGGGGERGPPRGGGGGQFGGGGPTGEGGSMIEMMVPGEMVGAIIGSRGNTIRWLQEQSGAKIVIIQDDVSRHNRYQEKLLRITGTPDGVKQAERLVVDTLNRQSSEGGQRQGQQAF